MSPDVCERELRTPALRDGAQQRIVAAEPGIPAHGLERGLARDRQQPHVAHQIGDQQIRQPAVLTRAEELAGTADTQVRLRDRETVAQ